MLEPTQSPGSWQWNVGAWTSYSHMPVVLREHVDEHRRLGSARARPRRGPGGRASAWGIARRSGVDIPVVLFQDGTSGLPSTIVSGGKVPSSGLGDIAILGKGTLVAQRHRTAFRSASASPRSARSSIPTGERAGFAGDGSTTVTLRLLAEYALGPGALRASLGYTLRTAQQTWPDTSLGGVTFGDEIPWSVGATLRPKVLFPSLDSDDRQSWEIALHGALPATPVAPFQAGASSLSPALLGARRSRGARALPRRVRPRRRPTWGSTRRWACPPSASSSRWAGRRARTTATATASRTTSTSARICPRTSTGSRTRTDAPRTTPTATASSTRRTPARWCPACGGTTRRRTAAPRPTPTATACPDPVDACPAVKGVPSDDPKKNGCPAAAQDRDKDGIPDDADKCPDQAEDKDGFEDFDGCPDPDNDGDGIPDREDACPRVKGEPSMDPTRNGCPNPDRDGDTYDNDVDQCPDQAEVFNGVKDDDGCPDEGGRPLAVVDVVKGAVVLQVTQPILFTGTSDTLAIDPKSATTLRAVALELNRRPDWTLAVGARPGVGKPEEAQRGSLQRALLVANRIATYTHRPGAAEAVGWDAVRQQPGAATGIAFAVLLGTRERPPAPLPDKKDPKEKP